MSEPDQTDTELHGTDNSDAAGAEETQNLLAEATLVGRAQDGDVASFESLVRRYSAPVFRLAQRTLTDRGDAEDVVQDTFVVVWRRLPTLNDPTLFRAWVYQIATRRCLNVLRTRTRRLATPVEADDLDAAAAATYPDRATTTTPTDPARQVEHAAQLAGLDTVLATLTDEQRVCWVLREFNELSYTEIAYATRLPVATVRGRIARARQNLAKGMDSWR